MFYLTTHSTHFIYGYEFPVLVTWQTDENIEFDFYFNEININDVYVLGIIMRDAIHTVRKTVLRFVFA